MKKIAFAFVVGFCFTAVGITGCGGSGETSVVEQDPDATESGLSAEDQQGYEEAMKNQRQQPGK